MGHHHRSRSDSRLNSRRHFAKPQLELLEDRCTPAIIMTGGSAQWQPTGPILTQTDSQVMVSNSPDRPVTGAIEGLAAHPTDPNILFVGGTNGGVWRTSNAQAPAPTWQPLTDDLPSLSIGDISINPNNPNEVLVGIGGYAAGVGRTGDLIGALYSTNALDPFPTFTVLGGAIQNQNIRSAVVRDGYQLIGGTGGIFGGGTPNFGMPGSIFRSLDNGVTFTDLAGTGNLPASAPINEIIPDPVEPQRVYIATDQAIFRTDDILAPTPMWTNITSAVLGITAGTARIRMDVHRSGAGEALYVGVIDGFSQLTAVSYSIDRGANFIAMDLPESLTAPVVVTAASNAAPIAITVDQSLNLVTGDRVVISGATGNTAANGSFTVTVTSATTFTLNGSTGNGNYTGGAIAQAVFGPTPGQQGDLHFAFAADPSNPNLIYLAGDRQQNPFPNGIGAGTFSGNSFRGDRSVAPGGPAPSPQWTPLTDDFAGGGTYHHADSRNIVFDASGNIIQVDDGGVYRRVAPQTTSGSWESVVGDLSLGQFYTARYDIRNNVIFGGTQDTGSLQQTSGVGQLGDPIYENTLGGDGFWQAVDNISDPNITYRYQMGNFVITLTRFGYDNNNNLVSDQRVLFANPATPNIPFSALSAGEQFSFGVNIFSINNVDGNLLMLGFDDVNRLYEDADPDGLAGDTVTDITPTGMQGTTEAIVYGGFENGVGIPQIAYVGTDAGELFVRGATGGFSAVAAPGTGSFFDIEIDPDDWRSVYILRGDTGERGGNQIYFSSDAGATWVDLTENLIGTTLNPDGTVANGLSTLINALQIFDTNPGTTDGEEYVIAAGRGGVFRRVPSLQGPDDAGPWSEYGVGLPNSLLIDVELYNNDRLVAATFGRGVFVLDNVAASIATDTVIQVIGDDNANFMTMTPDPDNPANIIVSDGLGNSLSFVADTVFRVDFLGLGGADTVLFSANGQPGGDFSRFSFPTTVDLGGDVGDVFQLNDFNRPQSVLVSVTGNTIGAGAGDNLFASKVTAGVTYTGLQKGTLIVDLAPDAANGHTIRAASSGAAATVLAGSNAGDNFLLGGPRGLDTLANVTIDARGGASDFLVIDDSGSKIGNANVGITSAAVTGIAGPTNTGSIGLAGIDKLTVNGSNGSENYTVDGIDIPLTLNTFAGDDNINLLRVVSTTKIDAGAGNDRVRLAGNLGAITGKVTIESGSGDNQLIVDNSDSPNGSKYLLTANTISGATSTPISYFATGGRYFDSKTGEGLLIRGSNVGDDSFSVFNSQPGSQVVLDGAGGNDNFTVNAGVLLGSFELRGGTGDDIFAVNLGEAGAATDNFLINGGEGTDSASLAGAGGDDNLTITFTDGRTGSSTGIGRPIGFAATEAIGFDGGGGRNTLNIMDATSGARGSAANPGAGIVYQPFTEFAGEFRFGDPAIDSSVNFNNINGKESNGLVVFGSATGAPGTRDALTVLAVSDTGRGQGGILSETTATNGADIITVSDSKVTIQNSSLGFLRTVALGSINGQPTIGALIVRGGDEARVGDKFTVTPSQAVPIFVFGGAPTGGNQGDTLIINSETPRQLDVIVSDVGNRQPIFRFNDGSIIGFSGFESSSGGGGFGGIPSTYAVGADIGGGPRVRVYDAGSGAVLFDQFVYAPTFTGGVRVATGDVTGDGIPDLIVGSGIGGGPHIQVIDGVSFETVSSFFAYEDSFRGGVYVSVADIDGDGRQDILVGSGIGGGPVVRIFDGAGNMMASFMAYEESFRGGVRVTAADVTGDGIPEIITGAGMGASPLVKVFDSRTFQMLFEYFSGDPNTRNGLFVAAGDLDGDGAAEIVTGPGSDSSSEVLVRASNSGEIIRIGVFDIGPIASPDPLPLVPSIVLRAVSNQQPVTEEGGIRVTVNNFDQSSGTPEILTARGVGYPSRVHAYSLNPMAEVGNFVAFEPTFQGGVFIG